MIEINQIERKNYYIIYIYFLVLMKMIIGYQYTNQKVFSKIKSTNVEHQVEYYYYQENYLMLKKILNMQKI